jgi:D-3-phosphoglycerate dehydrogenase
VSNTPSAVDDATADCNMFLILGALRGFNGGMQALRAGNWRGRPPPTLGHDPQGKTLGILGMGGIGRTLRDRARVFGMDVVYHSRRRVQGEAEGGAEYVEFEELLRRSDVLSLNLPLNVSAGLPSRI